MMDITTVCPASHLKTLVRDVANTVLVHEDNIYMLLLVILGIADDGEGNSYVDALCVDEVYGVDSPEAIDEMNALLFALARTGLLSVYTDGEFGIELTVPTELALRKMFPTHEELAEGAAA